ncbi:MAG: hypothetical protein DCC75_10390 [Proteobacteria bacterium]|nr:MAG: hypothetical protein DCC75_10390 [Pseudomonadota bacterium]
MKRKLFSQDSDRGFSITELLVAAFLSLAILGMGLSATITNRNLYTRDVVSTRINQNLRAAFDIIGMNVRQAGEALDGFFPAIEIQDGTSGLPDTLILRRNLYENEVLNVCQNLTSGTSSSNILVAYNTTTSGCAYSTDLAPSVTAWNGYITSEGGSARAYAYNRTSRVGEFFNVTGVTDNSATQQITVARTPGSWTNSYIGDGNSAALYLLEEYRFRVQDGVLQLVINEDYLNALNVVDGITDFQVTANMLGGTTVTTLASTDSWPQIQYLQLTMSGEDTALGREINSSLSTRLFPRNILSQ